jgi:RNA polymerase primary sigma factor
VPVHMSDRIRRLYNTARELEQEHGRRPTPEEIADVMDMEPRKVQWMLRVSWRPLSLEQPVGEEEDSELGSFIEDDSSPTPTQTAYRYLLGEKIEEMLGTLNPREARILRLRFGLNNGRMHTLEEVGRKFGLTRERIRQIEGRALRRLRHPCRSRQLRDYLS